MGFSLESLVDPLDLSGQRAASSQLETAQSNAALLRTFFNQSQENLQPFLDVSNQALPGLEQGASTGGFFDTANQLRPLTAGIRESVTEERLGDLNAQLGQRGLTRSGFAAQSAADIQEDTDLSLLLQLQSMLTGRQQQVAGQGASAGTALSRLGQSSAEQLGQIQSQGILGAQAATAAGQQNLIGLAGLGASFANRPPQQGVPINQQIANNPNTLGTITPVR